MKYIIRKKISDENRLLINKIEDEILSERIRNIIYNRIEQYNEKLGIHYVVEDVYTFENFRERCLEVRIVIDTLNLIECKEYEEELFNETFTN